MPNSSKLKPTANGAAKERPKTALIYLRVSSVSQLGGDVGRDGFSVPAQRDACLKKADNLEAEVIAEFVERGESGQTTVRRSALAGMLDRLTQGDVDYVIVHKLDRLARNRADDVEIVAKIRATGAQLVSVSENIDETPSGLLLHGIMSSIAEFYSKNLAAEVMKGTVEKAKTGGTPYKAPIGYLNQRLWITDDGLPVDSGNELAREIRTIALDPDRARFVTDAFRLYATGNYALSDLAAILEERGFKTRASRRAPAQAVSISRLHVMLKNDYYLGIVRYRGQVYPGRHQPLTDEATFEKVQTVLAAQRQRGTTAWRHHHFLIGSLYCAECGRRLIYSRNTGNGGLYEYFICAGRQAGTCQQPCHRVEAVEIAVEQYYATVSISQARRDLIERDLYVFVENIAGRASVELQRAEQILSDLKRQEKKLMTAHYADQVSEEFFAEEQTRMRRERIAAEMTIERLSIQSDKVREGIKASLDLTTDVQRTYLVGDPQLKRLLNLSIFDQLQIDREMVSGAVLNRPFRDYAAMKPDPDAVSAPLPPESLAPVATPDGTSPTAVLTPENEKGAPFGAPLSWGEIETSDRFFSVAGLNFFEMVGETGFEPATARPPAGCATRLRHSPLASGRRDSNPLHELGRLVCSR